MILKICEVGDPVLRKAARSLFADEIRSKDKKTYSWIKVQSGDSLWDDRITQDVDAQLAAKGWTKVDSGGDAAITAFRSTPGSADSRDLLRRPLAVAGAGADSAEMVLLRRLRAHMSATSWSTFSTRTHKLLWRGKDCQDLSSNTNKNSQQMQKGIANMFKPFPPK